MEEDWGRGEKKKPAVEKLTEEKEPGGAEPAKEIRMGRNWGERQRNERGGIGEKKKKRIWRKIRRRSQYYLDNDSRC